MEIGDKKEAKGMANDYWSNLDSGYDVSPLFGGSVNASGSMLSDYASIKNGSYGKLMKAYCARKDAEKAASSASSGDARGAPPASEPMCWCVSAPPLPCSPTSI